MTLRRCRVQDGRTQVKQQKSFEIYSNIEFLRIKHRLKTRRALFYNEFFLEEAALSEAL